MKIPLFMNGTTTNALIHSTKTISLMEKSKFENRFLSSFSNEEGDCATMLRSKVRLTVIYKKFLLLLESKWNTYNLKTI